MADVLNACSKACECLLNNHSCFGTGVPLLTTKLYVCVCCQTVLAGTCLEWDNLHSRSDERLSPPLPLPKQLTVMIAVVRAPWKSRLGLVSTSVCPRRKITPLPARLNKYQGQVMFMWLFIVPGKEGEVQPPEEDEVSQSAVVLSWRWLCWVHAAFFFSLLGRCFFLH